jgi:2-polyprenyl-3-methyl-5-hydroxy-6-metoxy-1,4-benzoquinol methylase
MIHSDLSYLRRMSKRTGPDALPRSLASDVALLREKKFMQAQGLFFSVVEALNGTVDFEIADMREVHAVAALGKDVKGKRVLDIACGSVEPYVLEDTFRDRYPPFFAEMMARQGATVTGADIRSNPAATYDHRVLDCTKADWASSLQPPYDIVVCFNVFNAPHSPFEHDAALCDRIMNDIHGLLAPGGIAIVTLRDDISNPESYMLLKGFTLVHCDGNTAWVSPVIRT